MSADRIDVLAAMDSGAAGLDASGRNGRASRLREVRAAVAEMMEKARRLEMTANSLRYCYSKRPENFAACFQQLDEDAAELRAALARVGGAA